MKRKELGTLATLILVAASCANGLLGQCVIERRAPWLGSDTVTYQLLNYPSRSVVDDGAVDVTLHQAFTRWGAATGVTFARVDTDPTITVEFYRGGDSGFARPLDDTAWEPPSGDSAVALATIGGVRIGFDDRQVWDVVHLPNGLRRSISDMGGARSVAVLFDRIATHEIGHAVGLPHSDDPGDVMYPFPVRHQLSDADIRRTRAIVRRTCGNGPRRPGPATPSTGSQADSEID